MVPQKAERCVPRIQPIGSRLGKNVRFSDWHIPNDIAAITKGCRRYALAQCRLVASASAIARESQGQPAYTRPDERIGA
jgi:hypothetical protein